MGKIPQGILGGVSGTVGSVVGGGWKGIAYLRSKPLSVANPRTVGQVNQRNKMTFMVIVSQALLSLIIKPLWDRFAQKQSGYNAFVSANISNVDDAGESFLDASAVIISKGKIEPTPITGSNATEGATSYTVTWGTGTTGQQQSTDIAYVVGINTGGDGVILSANNGVARSTGTITVQTQELQASSVLALYLAFRSADGRNVSDNSYFNVTLS